MKIAIDGPAGAGKSTIARRLAQELGFVYVDTGAMYRALTWKALRQGIPLDDPQSLAQLALQTRIRFSYTSNGQKVWCDDMDVTDSIRSPEVTARVSQLASHRQVRSILVAMQREMAKSESVVMDGRDIGECVLPDAEYKFFLTATLEERARRRAREMNIPCDADRLLQLEKEIMERDENDSAREVGALRVLDDSIIIDTSYMQADEVLASVLNIVKEAGGALQNN